MNSIKYGENGINFVLLHGMFGSGKNWNTFAAYFKQNFRVWTLDARNHGDSAHSNHMNYYEMLGIAIIIMGVLILNFNKST